MSNTPFSAIRLGVESPEAIEARSHGEVTKAETINYRKLIPEESGLFSQRIFGPIQNYTCECGKYKRQRYAGIECDKCKVEVTRKEVRRERMGHIKLASPVTHVWFVHSTPSPIGMLLDLTMRELENVVYFARWMVTSVDEKYRDKMKGQIEQDTAAALTALEEESTTLLASLEGEEKQAVEAKIKERKSEIDTQADKWRKELAVIKPGHVMTNDAKVELEQQYPGLFRSLQGAEAVLEVLSKTDMEALQTEVEGVIANTPTVSAKRIKLTRRLNLIRAMRAANINPAWMVLTVIPVLPPDLRPMIQLEGGRFASKDVNDLYRRVINRNNRLKRLQDLRAPDIIVINEKRMLQEAVDTLMDNGKRGAAFQENGVEKQSLAHALKGKEGLFRKNLLGKRVDYSGRSVIVVGPQLKFNQCGLPKTMALELFKPFVMSWLTRNAEASSVKAAKRMVEAQEPIVWEALLDVIKNRPVLLNRAPTLHRLGIQAFEPVIIEGRAIQLHPLVCDAFGADFDGDQMAVHVPLSQNAVNEAYSRMISTENIFSPADGSPLASPKLEMVMGAYYLTQLWEKAKGAGKTFSNPQEALLALDRGGINVQAPISVRFEDGTWRETSVGRILFNRTLPEGHRYVEEEVTSKDLAQLVREIGEQHGTQVCADTLDKMKDTMFWAATKSGASIGIQDLTIPEARAGILTKADKRTEALLKQREKGEITEEQRLASFMKVWEETTLEVKNAVEKSMDRRSPLYWMSHSGARGDMDQIKQLMGIRGLMVDPSGKAVETPIKTNFREGHTMLEFFISMHGSRKGQADTAIKTSDAGYLTRRLADVAQDVVIREADCGTTDGRILYPRHMEPGTIVLSAVGRYLAADAVGSKGQTVLKTGDEVTLINSKTLLENEVTTLSVRSPLTCALNYGICQVCYGRDLSRNRIIAQGEAAGIIAAQSIGEPGTQLTLRTFHTGGIAGASDITAKGGLKAVEDILEARTPAIPAVLAEDSGTVRIGYNDHGAQAVEIQSESITEFLGIVPKGKKLKLNDGDPIAKNGLWATGQRSPVAGTFKVQSNLAFVEGERLARTYPVPVGQEVIFKEGEFVEAGAKLTDGNADPKEVLRLRGQTSLTDFLIDEVQKVYRNHANLHDKHIEVIIRQMLQRVRVVSSGDSPLLPGEMVERGRLLARNADIIAQGGEPAVAEPVLYGISKAAGSVDSFLSAASFQKTNEVLTLAAVHGRIDPLRGLKENVILGRLMPAGTGYNPEIEAEALADPLSDLLGLDELLEV